MESEFLESAGLTAGEAKAYLALLELGESASGAIIQKSGISSSKVYEILDRLVGKGLVSYVLKEKTRHFHPAPPSRLLEYIGRQEAKLAGQKQKVEEMLPRLEKLQLGGQPFRSAEVYEGYEGLRTLFDLLLHLHKSGEVYCVFFTTGGGPMDEKVERFFDNYHRRRAKTGIRVKLIADVGSAAFLKPLMKYRGYDVRYYPNPMPLGVYIFKDYVATLSFRQKPVVFLLKSEEIADSYRNFFMGLWEKSKKK